MKKLLLALLLPACGAASTVGVEPPAPAPSPAPADPVPDVPPGARLARIEVLITPGAGGDAVRKTIRFGYDGAGRVVSEAHEGGGEQAHRVTYAFDEAGREVSRVSTTGLTGETVESAYDAQGRLARRCSYQNVGPLAVMPNNGCVRFVYDASGRLVRELATHFMSHEEPPNAAATVTDVKTSLDAAGRVAAVVRVEGGVEVQRKTFERDAAGRVIVETTDDPRTPEVERVERTAWDAAGQIVRRVVVRWSPNDGPRGEGVYEYANGRLSRARGLLFEEVGFHAGRAEARWVY